MKASLKLNDQAVSPIVATLVLIVVAVVGAVAVGTIMGTFSNDVSSQASAGDVSGASQTELIVAGSTTVQPVSELLAEEYMAKNPAIKISVQGGGSGAGVNSVGMGVADIGAASREMTSDEKTKYPDLVQHKIGGSIVVFIANEDLAGTIDTATELADEYDLNGAAALVAYERDESSGTEDTAKEYLKAESTTPTTFGFSGTTKVIGNDGMLKAVEDTVDGGATQAVGFVDWSFAKSSTEIVVADIDSTGAITWVAPSAMDTTELLTVTKAKAQTELGATAAQPTGTDYPVELARMLFYITGSSPSSVVNDYITFAQSPAMIGQYTTTGYWSIMELA